MTNAFSILNLATLATADDAKGFHAVLEWFNITSRWQMALVVFGLVAQATFFARWVVQWYASEKRGESHMPDLFWWLSLAGASMLLVYFILVREPVALLGQSVGWVIYTRNIYLIHRNRRLQKNDRSGSTPSSSDSATSEASDDTERPAKTADQSNGGAYQASTALDSGTGNS